MITFNQFRLFLMENEEDAKENPTYVVHASKLEGLKKAHEKIVKLANSLGQEPPKLNVGPLYMKERKIPLDEPDPVSGEKHKIVHDPVHDVTYEGKAPIVKDSSGNPLKIIGTREHVPDPNGGKGIVLNKVAPGESFNSDIKNRESLFCDHCKKLGHHGRAEMGSRVKTYVFQDHEGKQVEAGSSHAKEYFGKDLSAHLDYAESLHNFHDQFESTSDEAHQNNPFASHVSLRHALAAAHSSIEKNGFRPRTYEGTTTSQAVSAHFFQKPSKNYDPRIPISQSHWDKADATIAHFKNHPQKETNDYIRNASTIASTSTEKHPEGYVDHKGMGIAVSMAHAYNKHVEGEKEKKAQDAGFDQTPFNASHNDKKGKLSVTGKVHKIKRFDGFYGTTHFITAHVPSENGGHRIVSVKTTSESAHDLEENDPIQINGNIESHGTTNYHGKNNVTSMAPRTKVSRIIERHNVGDVLHFDHGTGENKQRYYSFKIEKVNKDKDNSYSGTVTNKEGKTYPHTMSHNSIDYEGGYKDLKEGIAAQAYSAFQAAKSGKIPKDKLVDVIKLKIEKDKQKNKQTLKDAGIFTVGGKNDN